MIEIKIILIGVAIICWIAAVKALMDLKSIVKSMRMTTGRIIKRCDNMISICEDAGKTRKRLIKTKWGRK